MNTFSDFHGVSHVFVAAITGKQQSAKQKCVRLQASDLNPAPNNQI